MHFPSTLRAGRRGRWQAWAAAAVLGAAALCSSAARAADADPPGRVGRLSWLAGEATLRSAADGSSSPAQRNWPLSSGDGLSTSPSGRAEAWIGSMALRLDVGTDMAVDRLDDQQLRLQLQRGSLSLRVATVDGPGNDSIDTPAGRVSFTEPGELRIDARGNTVDVTAWKGAALVESASGNLTVRAGQRVSFTLSPPASSLATPVQDDFRAFVAQRDASFEGHAATHYVSPETTGVEDLDRYGQWTTTPDYGAVWVPAVTAGWAPYRYGHWASVAPWGWTWIDDAPWGFAPFHYGRWAQWQGNWCWVPGRFVARPVYAPALVGWAGSPGVGVSVHVGVGAQPVGWFPLAPHEVYVPPYAVSPTYVRNVNVTHVTNINVTNIHNTTIVAPAHYAFQGDAHAMTVVPGDVMSRHAAVSAHVMAASDERAHALYAAEARPTPPLQPMAVHGNPQAHAAGPAPGALHAEQERAAQMRGEQVRGDQERAMRARGEQDHPPQAHAVQEHRADEHGVPSLAASERGPAPPVHGMPHAAPPRGEEVRAPQALPRALPAQEHRAAVHEGLRPHGPERGREPEGRRGD